MKWASCLIVTAVAGCAHVAPVERLPTFPRVDDRATLAAIAKQFHSVHDVSAQGELDLTESNGDHVRLDVAMALRPPNEARVRAWKFGQAVFDVTVTPEGVWLLATGGDDRTAKLKISAAQLSHSLALLSGAVFDQPGLQLHDNGDQLIVRREQPGEPTIRCTIDEATRTVRKYELLDEHDVTRFSLTQSEFAEHDGIAWPGRIVAVSEGGTIDILLHEVDINGGLPSEAFVPPRRASRLP